MNMSDVVTAPCLMDVVVFAGNGGVGSSDLGPLTAFEPKSMLMVCNRPLIWYCLLPWVEAGFRTFFVCVNEDTMTLRAYLTRELPNIEFHFVDVPLKVNDHDSTTCDCVKAYLEYKQYLRSGNRHMPDSPIHDEIKSQREHSQHSFANDKKCNTYGDESTTDALREEGRAITSNITFDSPSASASATNINNGNNTTKRASALRLELTEKNEQREHLSMLGLARDAILINCDTILAGVNIEHFVESFYTSLSSVTALFFKPASNKNTGKSNGTAGVNNSNTTRGVTSNNNNNNNTKKNAMDGIAITAGMKAGASKHHSTSTTINQTHGSVNSSTLLSVTSLYHAPLHTCAHSFTAVGYEERDFAQGDSSNLSSNCYSSASGLLSNTEAGTRLASPTTLLNTSRSMSSLQCVQPLPHVNSTFVSSLSSLLMENAEGTSTKHVHGAAETNFTVNKVNVWDSPKTHHALPQCMLVPRLHRMHYMAPVEEEPEVRISMAFAARRPDLVFTSNLIDSHVYCVRHWVLQYIASSAGVAEVSVRRTIIPLLARSQHASVNLSEGKFATADRKIKFNIPLHWMHEEDGNHVNVDQLNAVNKSTIPYTADKLRVHCAICEEDTRLPCKVCCVNNTQTYRALNEEIVAAKSMLLRWHQHECEERAQRMMHHDEQHSPHRLQSPNLLMRSNFSSPHSIHSPTTRMGSAFMASPMINSPRLVDEQIWQLMSACATSTLQPDTVMNVKQTVDKWFVNIEDSFVDCDVPNNVTITRSVIGASVLLSEGVRIIDSIILANVEIGPRTLIARSVIGTSAVISAGCKVTNSVVGPRCMVESDVQDNTVQ